MFELLSYSFMQKALIGGFLIAFTCGLMSPFIVLRRLSLLGDGIAHFSFGGIALGLLLGIEPIIAALISAVVGGFIVQQLVKKNLYGDAAISLILSFGVGLGIIVIGLARGFNVNLFSYLIGSLLSLTYLDIALAAAMLVLIAAFLVWGYNQLVFSSFNQELAELRSKKTIFINTIFILLVTLTVVISIRAVGILLVSAMLVIPTLIALQLSKSFKGTLVISTIASVLATLIGIVASYYLNIPPSGTIVMLLFLLFIGVQVPKFVRTIS